MVHNLTLEDKEDRDGSSSDQLVEGESEKDRALAKRKYVLNELIDTEKDYVNNLGLIVDGYLNFMRSDTNESQIPDDLKNGKDKIIFGNIENIYEWHKEYVSSELMSQFV